MAATQIEKEVKDYLKTLGSGPNKVAESLTELKIKGTVGDGRDCPVTKALRKKFKNLKGLYVADNVCFSHKQEEYELEYPAAIGKFIEKFDKGEYPALATKTSLAEVS